MTLLRVLLDTNAFLSALLFGGELSRLVTLWQKGAFRYLITRPILDEYVRTLAYPKFQLTDLEIKSLIEEDVLPFVEVIAESKARVPRLKDRDDEKFLSAAWGGQADVLVTGDNVLLEVGRIGKAVIETPREFLKRFDATPRSS